MSDYVFNNAQDVAVSDDFAFDLDIDQYIDPALLALHPLSVGQSG
jgi:hypothetical protein